MVAPVAAITLIGYILLWCLNCFSLKGGLVSASCDAEYLLFATCTSPPSQDDLELVMQALEQGADINAKHDESGQTALMAAVLRGKTIIVSYLLKSGADPMIGEKNGYHPPHGAAFQGRPEVMQLLIDFGLDVNSFHKDGFLPLHRTCWGSEQRHADTLLVLLKHGIDPEVKSKDGRTCREMTENKFILSTLDSWSKTVRSEL